MDSVEGTEMEAVERIPWHEAVGRVALDDGGLAGYGARLHLPALVTAVSRFGDRVILTMGPSAATVEAEDRHVAVLVRSRPTSRIEVRPAYDLYEVSVACNAPECRRWEADLECQPSVDEVVKVWEAHLDVHPDA